MDEIKVRYGESFDLEILSDDLAAQTVTLYVGKVGQTAKITVPATFGEGVAYIVGTEEDTKIPLGTYKYMLKVETTDGKTYKFPTADECEESGLPDFTVSEALDETEVV